MTRVKATPSSLACIGMLAGLLLLGFAGTLVVLTPASIMTDLQREGAAAVLFLQKEVPRRLQPEVVPPAAPIDTLNVYGATTTRPSSFDSSDSNSMGSSLEPLKSSESGSFKTMPKPLEESTGTVAYSSSSVAFQLVVMLCFACIYHSKAVQPIIRQRGTLAQRPNAFQPTGKDDFDHSICGCFDDMWVCIHGFCCPLVRIAHTNAVSGVMGFWQSAIAFCCCSLFTSGLGTCCLMVYWRKQLKDIMGIEDHIVNDLCITCFCPMLSICQSGTSVDQAMGYEVTGCCTLENTDYY